MDLLEGWTAFIEVFLRWHHMFNDFFDWYRDIKRGGNTYLLNEARRSDKGEVEWFVSEGFDWGRARLDEWFEESWERAEALGCEPLMEYLEIRRLHFAQQLAALQPAMRALAAFAPAFK